ncbi:MAG TPA: hypothetical protein VHP36_07920 [Chitinispirillaceae bacterium]|nr:hypothetical protein [Chitinispirillaceae bacterium]
MKKIQGTNFSYPYLTASASIDSADNINITIANSDLSNAKDLAIQLNGNTTYQSVSGQIITASQVTALNDFGKAEQVFFWHFDEL